MRNERKPSDTNWYETGFKTQVVGNVTSDGQLTKATRANLCREVWS